MVSKWTIKGKGSAMQEYFMGVDIGTSGTRAVLFDASGYEVAVSRQEYPLLCPQQ